MSERAAPVLFIPTREGKKRFSIDYRKINSMIFKNKYPLQGMEECNDIIGKPKYVTTLDAYYGYSQMNIPKQDSEGKPSSATRERSNTFVDLKGFENVPACF